MKRYQWIVIFLVFFACSRSNPTVTMTTPLGKIQLEIYADRAPVTAANFLNYVDKQLFAGAHFYRVVTQANQPGDSILIEVIQGGLGWGENPQRQAPIAHETTQMTGILHEDGVISMARDKPGSADAEFFICIGPQPELDFGGHRNPDGQGFAAFGRVIAGMEVVHKIHKLPEKEQMLLEKLPITAITRD